MVPTSRKKKRHFQAFAQGVLEAVTKRIFRILKHRLQLFPTMKHLGELKARVARNGCKQCRMHPSIHSKPLHGRVLHLVHSKSVLSWTAPLGSPSHNWPLGGFKNGEAAGSTTSLTSNTQTRPPSFLPLRLAAVCTFFHGSLHDRNF